MNSYLLRNLRNLRIVLLKDLYTQIAQIYTEKARLNKTDDHDSADQVCDVLT